MDAPNPIEDLFKQLREGQEFAKKGGETIDDNTLVRYGYEVINNTGMFESKCAKRRKKKANEQTWEAFQTYWTIEVSDFIKNSTAESTTFTAAQVQEIIEHEVAAATAAVQSIPKPPPPPEATPSANAVTQADITNMIAQAINQLQPSGPKGITPPTTKPKKTPLVCQGHNAEGQPITYCWTHGVTKNLRYNSTTCQRKAEGHKDQATLLNRMGDNDATCEKRK